MSWYVLKSLDGRYGASIWEIMNTALRRPRLGLSSGLNDVPLDTVILLYPSYLDAVGGSVWFHDVRGEITIPTEVEIHGQGQKTILLEARS